jgi:hypothetical protein
MRAAPERRTVAYATSLALIVVCYAYSAAGASMGGAAH